MLSPKEYEVVVTIAELYNDRVRVLVDYEIITSSKDAWRLLNGANKSRIVQSTNANEHNIRSHWFVITTISSTTCTTSTYIQDYTVHVCPST